MGLEELADRLAIRELIDRYADAITRGDFEQHITCFLPDGVWHVAAPFEYHIVGATNIRDYVAGSSGKMDFLIQLNSSTTIHSLTADRANATTTVREMGKASDGSRSFTNYGVYDDDIVKVDGEWKFAKRHFQPIYMDKSALTGTSIAGRTQLGHVDHTSY